MKIKYQNHSQHNSRLETPSKKQNCVDKNIQEEFNKFWKDNWRANGGEINQWAFMFWQNAWIKSRKQTLEEVRKMIKNNIDEWWYSLDENHRPFANETNRLIKELLNKLEEIKK